MLARLLAFAGGAAAARQLSGGGAFPAPVGTFRATFNIVTELNGVDVNEFNGNIDAQDSYREAIVETVAGTGLGITTSDVTNVLARSASERRRLLDTESGVLISCDIGVDVNDEAEADEDFNDIVDPIADNLDNGVFVQLVLTLTVQKDPNVAENVFTDPSAGVNAGAKLKKESKVVDVVAKIPTTPAPTRAPTRAPTAAPTPSPTSSAAKSFAPTAAPTSFPSFLTPQPSAQPTPFPSFHTQEPTPVPTSFPSYETPQPSSAPTVLPTSFPSYETPAPTFDTPLPTQKKTPSPTPAKP
mmetsp:Transcript_23467/g.80150  ORF Transcript_23467/g.80150 Transcript_23467/m.80150 type:complete len:299 (-) Transcript_23467:74-970(-)